MQSRQCVASLPTEGRTLYEVYNKLYPLHRELTAIPIFLSNLFEKLAKLCVTESSLFFFG